MAFDYVDEEWAHELEVSLEEYMEQLSALLYDEDEVAKDFETVSGEGYCGCSICEIREILSFVIPRAIQGYLDGKVVLEAVDDLKPTETPESS
jgi:hypothetical protein